MKFVGHNQIDKKRWDELVANSKQNNITCYSWYLDAVTEKWGAIINDDYTFGLPLPYKNRILYKYFFQPPFTRSLDFFGDENHLAEAINILKKLGKSLFHFPYQVDLPSEKRIYQKLNLKSEIEYKTNAKRILKKIDSTFDFKITENSQSVANLYFENSFNKINQSKKNKIFFSKAIQNAISHKKGITIEAYDINQKLVGAAFYLMDKGTVYYMIGDSNPEYKSQGVMYGIMDFAIRHFKNNFTYFDFGGSNIKSVAEFYHKMGGQDVIYYQCKSE